MKLVKEINFNKRCKMDECSDHEITKNVRYRIIGERGERKSCKSVAKIMTDR